MSYKHIPALPDLNVGKFHEMFQPEKKSLNRTLLTRRSNPPPLIAIGASAGGPKALATILSQLPQNFGAAIAIAQHIDAQFAPELANWLDRQTSLSVELAKVGSSPEPGKVSLAAKNDHLVLRSNLTFSYSQYPQDDPYRPSVNALFNSFANYWPSPAIAILLTGMGSDGAIGLKQLCHAGWHTIAQDRQTCAVYGMPKAAVDLGAAVEILPLEAIAPALLNRVPYSQPQDISFVSSKIFNR